MPQTRGLLYGLAMKNKGNLVLVVLFFALLTFALWRFYAVKEEVMVAVVSQNMYTVKARLEEFKARAGAYPVDIDLMVSQAIDTLESDYSVSGALENDQLVNPFGGTPLITLAPNSQLPEQSTPGAVVYLPMDTLPGGKLARSFKLSGYNRLGKRLGLVLSPDENQEKVSQDTQSVQLEK